MYVSANSFGRKVKSIPTADGKDWETQKIKYAIGQKEFIMFGSADGKGWETQTMKLKE
jgi:hypothetical protein